jgi:hypothetical protein
MRFKVASQGIDMTSGGLDAKCFIDALADSGLTTLQKTPLWFIKHIEGNDGKGTIFVRV